MPPPAPAADDLQLLKEMPAPELTPDAAWAAALEFLRADISRIGFESLFSGCSAIRWRGCCLVIRHPQGANDDSYNMVRSRIKNALIRAIGSNNVGFEFESEVQYAGKT